MSIKKHDFMIEKHKYVKLLESRDFAFVWKHPLYIDRMIPGSPLNYATAENFIPDVGRVDIVIPLGIDDFNKTISNSLAIPFICETYLVDVNVERWTAFNLTNIEAYLNKVKKYIDIVQPRYLVFTFGRIHDKDILVYVMDFLSKDINLSVEKVINVHYYDYLKHSNALLELFDYININAVITNEKDYTMLNNVINDMVKESIHILRKIRMTIITNQNYVNNLIKIKNNPMPVLIVPVIRGNITNTAFELGIRDLYAQFTRFPDFAGLPHVYYGNFALCKYSNIAFYILPNGIKVCSCKAECSQSLYDDIECIALKTAIANWKNKPPCNACAFRLICCYCRYYIYRYVAERGGGCLLRDAYYLNSSVDTDKSG